jgi:hypothetical protein
VSTKSRTELHRLIDDLNDDQAARLLQLVSSPFERSLIFAPVDDEPVTEQELAAIAEGEAAYQRGEWTADNDLTL